MRAKDIYVRETGDKEPDNFNLVMKNEEYNMICSCGLKNK